MPHPTPLPAPRRRPAPEPRRPARVELEIWTQPGCYRPETRLERRFGRFCVGLAIATAVFFAARCLGWPA